MTRHFVPLAGFEPGIGLTPDCVCSGELLYLIDRMQLWAVDLAAPGVTWGRAWSKPAPAHYQVPRRARINGRRLWSRGDAVVALIDTEAGVAAVCCDGRTGRELWRREIATPPPVEWTEAEPAFPFAPTEEIDAALVLGEHLAVVLARSTRRMMQWQGTPIPSLRAQADVFALNPIDGTIRASTQVPGAYIPILEKSRLGRWLVVDRHVLELDVATATARTVAELESEPCWPREHGGKVTVAWRGRGVLTATTLDPVTGKREVEHRWKRTAVKSVALHPLSDGMALQVNEQFFNLLDERLAPRWEARIRPYIYGVAAHAGGPVFAAAAGGGGGLAAFARESGATLFETRLPGGAWHPMPIAGTDRIAAACGPGLVIASGAAAEVTAIPGARALVDVGPGRIALLCGSPTPGVHMLTFHGA